MTVSPAGSIRSRIQAVSLSAQATDHQHQGASFAVDGAEVIDDQIVEDAPDALSITV